MPTPSEVREPQAGVRSQQWAPSTDTPRRSVFGNYLPASEIEEAPPERAHPSPDAAPGAEPTGDPALALARAYLYRYLARAFEDPAPEKWGWLCSASTRQSLEIAAKLAVGCKAFALFAPETFETFCDAWLAAFGHAACGPCPINEIEYGDFNADPFFQPHCLADLAAFYRAFGLEVADDAGERHDHLCLELEFMCVLAAKEAWALTHPLGSEGLAMCREVQRQFLREHLGRWVPAFTRRLERHAAGTPLVELARFTRAFIEAECARLGVRPGSEDLLVYPADTAAAWCESCGLAQSLPGMAASAAA